MRTYYHGTASNFLPGILRDGLTYQRQNKWDVAIEFGSRTYKPQAWSEPKGYIYLTDNWGLAEHFAVNRARYLKALPDSIFEWDTTFTGYHKRFVPAKKGPGTLYVPDTYPVVLEITGHLDEKRMEEDWKSDYAYQYHGSVKPYDLRVIWDASKAPVDKF